MSGIYIKGMHAPTCCAKCEWLQQRFPGGSHYCKRSGKLVHATWASANLNPIPDSCPVIPVHGNGRLIDERDVLLAIVTAGQADKRFRWGETIKYSPSEVAEILERFVPTVIPASEEDGI